MALDSKNTKGIAAAIAVAALGYFVDVYDLILFGVIRIPSLKGLGFSGDELETLGGYLISSQMAGMLLGGIVWGILGDKIGRLNVLFGSILMYSLANIFNGMVDGVFMYGVWRFVAGFGLAGELGAGITLVSELLPKDKRGWGTTIVATVGVAGAIGAKLVADIFDSWRMSYYVGGGLGIVLLLLRIGVAESGMYAKAKSSKVERGNPLLLFNNRKRFLKYLRVILIGTPVWYVVGILMLFSDSLAEAMGVSSTIDPGRSIMYCYTGLVLGDLTSGSISQLIKSRKKVLYLYIGMTFVGTLLFLNMGVLGHISESIFYLICGILGYAIGYWVIFVTVAAEQFGTNIRATVTTTTPNFVRGSEILMSMGYLGLIDLYGDQRIWAALTVGMISIGLAFVSLIGLKETFQEDLNYMEEA